MNDLKYRVYSVSSESKRFPACNLFTGESGWQTAQNCTYPQQLTIQFYVPIHTKQLKMVLHQYKIPRMIQVFVKVRKNQKYRKLGYVLPSDNTQSNNENKQIITLLFEYSCSYIKFILHSNHQNPKNLFEQVAIEQLTVEGELLTHAEINNIGVTDVVSSSEEEEEDRVSLPLSSGIQEEQRSESMLSGDMAATFSQVFEGINSHKRDSVQKEDFKQAAYWKKIEEQFKDHENKAVRLEKDKKVALIKQDFDQCHRIKLQLSKIKQIIQYQRQQLFSGHASYPSAHPSYHSISKQQSSQHQISTSMHRIPLSSNHLDSFDQPNQPSSSYRNRQLQRQKEKEKEKDKEPIHQNQKFLNYDEEVIPTLRNKSNFKENPDNQESMQMEIQMQNSSVVNDKEEDLELLEQKTRLKVQRYFDIVEEEIWMKLYGRIWKTKTSALEQVTDLLCEITTKEEYLCGLQIVSITIQDSHPAVIIASYTLLQQIISSQIHFTLQGLPTFMQDIIRGVLGMLVDTNLKIKELAYETYLNFGYISFMNLSVPVNRLMKYKQSYHKGTKGDFKADPKLTLTKIVLMESMVSKYVDCIKYHSKDIVNWAVGFLDDPKKHIREEATNLLVKIAMNTQDHNFISEAMAKVRPSILQNFMLLLNASEQASQLASDSNIEDDVSHHYDASNNNDSYKSVNQNQSQKYQLKKIQQSPIYSQSQNEDVELAYSQESIFQSQQQSQSHDWQSLKNQTKRASDSQIPILSQDTCEFCYQGVVNMRSHLLDQCPVIVSCEFCQAKIYIREITTHLLEECHKANHQQCHRCGLAYEIDEINQHVGRGMCRLQKGEDFQRCQFCAMDIPADDMKWVEHALGCKQLPEGKKVEQSSEND